MFTDFLQEVIIYNDVPFPDQQIHSLCLFVVFTTSSASLSVQ